MVRVGIVGIGNMGRSHVTNYMDGKIENAVLTAICDIRPDRLQWAKDQGYTGLKLYENAQDMFQSGEVDAVVIATPHYDHPVLAIDALNAGLHTIVEKPAGVFTKKVREMNEVAAKSDKVFGIMYNQRTNPMYQKVRDLVKSGELGELKRIVWIITNWYRPQAYHDSSDWRSTWKDEGGGVLINQCPHQLDLIQWVIDEMPKRIRSFVGFGKYHNIEVEDDVTAYFEYENGATGLFVTCTAEAPGTNRLEIACDRGKIVIENDVLTFWRNRVPEREFNEKNEIPFAQPECWKCEIPVSGIGTQHVGIFNDWISAIENGTPLLAPGVEGIKGLSISNAIHLSAWTDRWIDPNNIDEDLFYEILQDKIKHSTIKKVVREKVSDVRGTH